MCLCSNTFYFYSILFHALYVLFYSSQKIEVFLMHK